MIEIVENLFVGSLNDYNRNKDQDFYFIQACKEPCHREAIGYKAKSLGRNHPEYFYANRPNRLILNMIDCDTEKYFSTLLFDKSIMFIDEALILNKRILIHCNQGVSRSPSIGLLFLAKKDIFKMILLRRLKKILLKYILNIIPVELEFF